MIKHIHVYLVKTIGIMFNSIHSFLKEFKTLDSLISSGNNNNNYTFISRTHLPKDTRGAQLKNCY